MAKTSITICTRTSTKAKADGICIGSTMEYSPVYRFHCIAPIHASSTDSVSPTSFCIYQCIHPIGNTSVSGIIACYYTCTMSTMSLKVIGTKLIIIVTRITYGRAMEDICCIHVEFRMRAINTCINNSSIPCPPCISLAPPIISINCIDAYVKCRVEHIVIPDHSNRRFFGQLFQVRNRHICSYRIIYLPAVFHFAIIDRHFFNYWRLYLIN